MGRNALDLNFDRQEGRVTVLPTCGRDAGAFLLSSSDVQARSSQMHLGSGAAQPSPHR